MRDITSFQTGLLIGHLLKHDVEVRPILDEDTNYSASIEIVVSMPAPSGLGGEFSQTIIVTVEPPPSPDDPPF